MADETHTRKRTFRKYSYRGVDLEQLMDMSTDELVELFAARQRRRYALSHLGVGRKVGMGFRSGSHSRARLATASPSRAPCGELCGCSEMQLVTSRLRHKRLESSAACPSLAMTLAQLWTCDTLRALAASTGCPALPHRNSPGPKMSIRPARLTDIRALSTPPGSSAASSATLLL